jgi:hypothetical protein
MSFLSSGQTMSITVPAGSTLLLSGGGTAQIVGPRVGHPRAITQNGIRIEAPGFARTVSLASDGPGITFQVVGDADYVVRQAGGGGNPAVLGSTPTAGGAVANPNNIAILGNSFVAKGASPFGWSAGTSWTPSTAITQSSVTIPNYFDCSKGFTAIKWVCTTAGTTDTMEPDWPHNAPVGTILTDGTVVWTATTMGGAGVFPCWSFGWWHFGQAMSGQRLNEVIVMGRSGRLCAEIMSYVPRVLARPEIGTVFFPHVFENDVSAAVTGGLPAIQQAFATWAAGVDQCRAAGKRVWIRTVAPSGFYDAASLFTTYTYGNCSKALTWLNNAIRAFAAARGDVIFEDIASDWIDPNPGNPSWPENTATYTSASGAGQQLKRTDGIHPNMAVHFSLGQKTAATIAANFQTRTIFSNALDYQCNTINPLNFGTAGTVSNISGAPATAPNSITLTANGATAASTTATGVARTDLPTSKWAEVGYVAAAGSNLAASWTTAPNINFAAGQVVQAFCEQRVKANPTLHQYSALFLRFPGVTDQWWYSSNPVATDQDWGQFITADTTFTFKSLPVVVPAGATTVNVFNECNFRGASAGTIDFGRAQVNLVTPPVAP